LLDTTSVDEALGVVYGQVWDRLVDQKSAWTYKTGYTTLSADTLTSSLPSDLWGQIRQVAINLDGTDLSANLTASRVMVNPSSYEDAMLEYRLGKADDSVYKYWVGESQKLAILPLLPTGGDSTCELVYQYAPTWGSADGDEPDLPLRYRPLLAYKAAAYLRTQYELALNDLMPQLQQLEGDMMRNCQPIIANVSRSFSVAGGRRKFDHRTQMGRIVRTG